VEREEDAIGAFIGDREALRNDDDGASLAGDDNDEDKSELDCVDDVDDNEEEEEEEESETDDSTSTDFKKPRC
jgi:cobalamin biosynthesis protein CobT